MERSPSASLQSLAPVQLATNCTTPCVFYGLLQPFPFALQHLIAFLRLKHANSLHCQQLHLKLLENPLQKEYIGLSICHLWMAGNEVSHPKEFLLLSCL